MNRKTRIGCCTMVVSAALLTCAPGADAAHPEAHERRTHIRAGSAGTIVAVRGRPASRDMRAEVAAVQYPYPHPRPRLAGFSPLIAITTSDAGFPLGHDFEFEHELESSYVGSALNPTADPGFVIGFLDTGSDVDLVAGTATDTLGLFGFNLTSNSIPIGGVGGEVDASISMPVGFFAAGLSAIDASGTLDYTALVGHSNVCGLAAPAIDCGSGEVLSAVIGMPFLYFYNSIIRVDTPRTVHVAGVTYTGPDVQIQQPYEPLPTFERTIALELGGLSPVVTTANYFPDFADLVTPVIPTLLSLFAGTIPGGGAFFTTIYVIEGEPGPTNPAQAMRVLVDTGAQSSIMSSAMAANLSLPFEPDFTVDVCGVGGLVEGVPGFYLDYIKINARGGALEFSRAPFVVLDLPSPEGGVLDGILGMNFFWNRNVIFEPLPLGVGFFHVSDPVPFAYGDFDVDLDVDVPDAETLVSCVTGPGAGTLNPVCDHIDGDDDGDVDLVDFKQFQLCFSGSGVTADAGCGF